MLNIFKLIVSFAKLSFYAHHGQFGVIRPVNGYKIEKVRQCWFISIGLYILTYLYGIFGLECESRPLCDIDWPSLPSSPYNAYHQMFPKEISKEVDFFMFSITILSVGSRINFLVSPPIERRFLIFVNTTGFEKKDELKQMWTFREHFLKFAFAMEIVIFIFGSVFVYVHVLSINANYNVNWTSFLYWTWLMPVQIYCNIVDVYTLPFYVILACKYVIIQQKALTRKLIDLNVGLSTVRLCPKLAKRRVTRHRLWLQYLQVNAQLCDLCRHVREYARYRSPFLTMLFGALISFQCYIFYRVLFVPELPYVLRFVLMLVIVGVVFNKLVLITQCAAVVKSFKKITRQNREFYKNYTNKQAAVGIILARNLLKAECLQDRRLLYSYAFRMFGNYRITSKSFHIIISYISLFFLYIVKNKYGSPN